MVSGYGNRIKLRRQALGMTQGQLAERVGVTASAVLAWEKERYFPSRYQGAVEAVLRISLDGDRPEPIVPRDDFEREAVTLNLEPGEVTKLIMMHRQELEALRGRSG